jgi:hypothetical protein
LPSSLYQQARLVLDENVPLINMEVHQIDPMFDNRKGRKRNRIQAKQSNPEDSLLQCDETHINKSHISSKKRKAKILNISQKENLDVNSPENIVLCNSEIRPSSRWGTPFHHKRHKSGISSSILNKSPMYEHQLNESLDLS